MKSYSNILCPYQQSIRLCVSDTWRLNKNMMVQMPTGIGKLHSLASVIHEHLQERQRQSVWIATHRRELVEQIEDTVVRYGIRKEEDWSVPPNGCHTIGRMWKMTGQT